MRRVLRTTLFGCLAVALPLSTGCAGRSAVRALPAGSGVAAEYRLGAERVSEAVPAALDQIGYGSIEEAGDSTGAIVLLASRGLNLVSWGEALRVRVEAGSQETSVVRVVGRPNNALDYTGRSKHHALELVERLDRSMGPENLVVRPGDRVRGRTAGGLVVEGTVAEAAGPSVVEWSGSDPETPGPVEALHVYRGGWDQSRTGLGVGAALGWLVGMALVASECPLGRECFTTYQRQSAMIPVGALLGWVVGKAFRTEIWSPITMPAGGRGGG